MTHSSSVGSPLQGLLAALATITMWTAFIVVAKASTHHTLSAYDIIFMRYLGASAVLLPWWWWRKRQNPSLPKGSLGGLSPLPLKVTVMAGFFGSFMYCMLAYTGFFFAPATHASVLMPGSLPLWTALLAILFLGERLNAWRWIGLLMILIGDLMVGGASLLHAFEGGTVWVGDLLYIGSAISWACYSVIARKHQLDAVNATTAITAFTFATYVPVYAIGATSGLIDSHLGQAPWFEWLFQSLMQGVGSVVISGITYTLMLKHYGPVKSTMMTSVVPPLSALCVVWFLGEAFTWNLAVGLALVTGGILVGVAYQWVASQAKAIRSNRS